MVIAHRLMQLLVLLVTIRRASISHGPIIIPGQTHEDDPNACFWFTYSEYKSVFRCCNGYTKKDTNNLSEDCVECPDGTFGMFCNSNCMCQNGGSCDKFDGSCQCSENFFGKTCEFPCNCENDATCMQDGSCRCTEEYYGILCEHRCACPANMKCQKATGECTCLDGFYGDTCLPCKCSENATCDQTDGHCNCKAGFYGERCEKQCNCYNGASCRDRGSGCDCTNGWFGPYCTVCDRDRLDEDGRYFCDDKCLYCYNGDVCSITAKDCNCTAGWQGIRCDQMCNGVFFGIDCAEKCQCVNGICHHVTGTCLCESGWTGHYCNQPCPDNCITCNDNVCMSCKPGWTDATCSRKCKYGFYGDGCQKRCPKCNCTDTCQHINGNCLNFVRCDEYDCKCHNARHCIEDPFRCECFDGWSGDLCDVKVCIAATYAYDTASTRYDPAEKHITYSDYHANGIKSYHDEASSSPGALSACLSVVLYAVLFNVM